MCFFIQNLFRRLHLQNLIDIYSYIILVVLSFLTVADLELYKVWGYRIDATPIRYFKHPKEMVASAGSSPVLLLLLIFAILVIFSIWGYNSIVKKSAYYRGRSFFLALLSFILLISLFIPIRGGFQQIPINQSDVYFSNKIFANHAAVNLPWNVMHSILNKEANTANPYSYFSQSEARGIVDSLYKPNTSFICNLLSVKRPNIIFIILESYTSKFIGCLGGEPGVTPHIDSIAKQGLLFTNIYASGDRSEKGLVALLSGYPTQTTTSIIFDPTKTEKLPHLQDFLKKEGYHSSYYYGGELEFANIKSYVLNSGYERLVSKSNFPSEDYNSKWGVHDHILLSKLQSDLKSEKQPFFTTIFTLSSHEPFEIPIPNKFPGNDETSKFKNSFYYTDQAIGTFITDARKQLWWDSTLIVMIADHGHRLPGEDANFVASKFRIPLILTGGALNEKGKINQTIGSQTDIAATILKSMGIPTGAFKWSQDLMDSGLPHFAFYVFNDGFGFITKTGSVAFDNISKKVVYQDTKIPGKELTTGKAYMQVSFEDFLNK